VAAKKCMMAERASRQRCQCRSLRMLSPLDAGELACQRSLSQGAHMGRGQCRTRVRRRKEREATPTAPEYLARICAGLRSLTAPESNRAATDGKNATQKRSALVHTSKTQKPHVQGGNDWCRITPEVHEAAAQRGQRHRMAHQRRLRQPLSGARQADGGRNRRFVDCLRWVRCDAETAAS